LFIKKTFDVEIAVELTKLGPYDHFGGVTIFFDRPYADTIKAKGPLKCLRIDDGKFKDVLEPMVRVFQRNTAQYAAFISAPV
jgi:cAMP-dependent protein kinase regulator